MASKGKKEEEQVIDTEEGLGMGEETYMPENGLSIEDDFNVEDEWKPSPLIPVGTYHGSVTAVKLDTDNQALVFDVCLNDNGGMMSDASTPIDGNVLPYKVWLPRKGDENALVKSGRQTKRQWKINNMRDVSDALHINISTPRAIIEGISNGEWIGLEVKVLISLTTWKGKTMNQIDSMVAA